MAVDNAFAFRYIWVNHRLLVVGERQNIMNLGAITVENFLTSTAAAYMLLMIGILLLANLFLNKPHTSKKPQSTT